MVQRKGEPAKRPRGRPRRNGAAADGSVRETIITVATRLFAEQGYADTTMTEIAAAAGLGQSSLYYWFSRKELLLQETLAVNRLSLDFAERVLTEPGTAGLKLYRLLRYDTLRLCLSPCDFNEIERLAEAQPTDFADFWRDYQRLSRYVIELVEQGVAAGEFRDCDPELAGAAALCLNEGMQKRFRTQARHQPGGASPFTHAQRTPERYADASASTTLTALLARPSALARIKERAAAADIAPMA